MKKLLFIQFFLFSSLAFGNQELEESAKIVSEATAEVNRILDAPNLSGCPVGPVDFQGQKIEIESKDFLQDRNGGEKIQVLKLKKPYPLFTSTDEAAKFFVNYLRQEFKDHRVEYCTDIKKAGIKFSFTDIIVGTPGSCPRPKDRDESVVVAGVHTHPGSHDPSHTHSLDLSINIPSVNDYAVASYEKKPQYMGAPSGHILKFTSEDTKCRGAAFLKRTYQMIQPPFENTRGKLKNQNSWTYIKSKEELNSMKRWICP
ncbi:MAG: hypothetical protein ACJAT2_001434 [Bacteriovoracaceae bacterium]|jgi:hypothetical protein